MLSYLLSSTSKLTSLSSFLSPEVPEGDVSINWDNNSVMSENFRYELAAIEEVELLEKRDNRFFEPIKTANGGLYDPAVTAVFKYASVDIAVNMGTVLKYSTILAMLNLGRHV
ncbi:hypothetical protein G6F46_007990 [Rhizopus delemar]|uniref:Uncharacterized protein n=2 Tax=Rhizopus TaxID=4842 RepID=A0A9P6Z0F8_9FUNG|nr:hypothetical protein G6F55_011672 [Rhizopus delemar]KAG1540827.1 hypothetical protein G6F51_008284 [Rhizopus arrhizus]KAG1488879.1 hypothetical protein G6F54_011830 [Rhizopus delemar]KAG1511432.1 hypothetical protein G6F52_010652 [Rhizopus delemar]KAG1516041.1 hypothetical protein G6F53_002462 [Rhizopus delemar]